MILNLVRDRSVLFLTFALTLCVVSIVTIMSFSVSTFFDRPNILFGTITGFVLSSLITPLISFSLVKSFKKTLKTEMELREALAKVETLSGLIPICSVCKDVRDDSGYWKKLEEYIAVNTTAEISHGICPNCMDDQLDEVRRFNEKTKSAS